MMHPHSHTTCMLVDLRIPQFSLAHIPPVLCVSQLVKPLTNSNTNTQRHPCGPGQTSRHAPVRPAAVPDALSHLPPPHVYPRAARRLASGFAPSFTRPPHAPCPPGPAVHSRRRRPPGSGRASVPSARG
jgi:hypothetical protein